MRPAELFYLFSSVTALRGVGPGSTEALSRLLSRFMRVADVTPTTEGKAEVPVANARKAAPYLRDLLFHLPTSVVDRTHNPAISQLTSGTVVTLVVRVMEHIPPPPRSRRPYQVICSDGTGEVVLTFFKGDKGYLTRQLPPEKERVISGTVEQYDGVWQMPHPDTIAPVSAFDAVARLDPVYPLTWGMTSKRVVQWVEQIFDKLPELTEWIEPTLHKAQGWPAWKPAFEQLHQVASLEVLEAEHPARQRVAYDELLASQLALALVRKRLQRQSGVEIAVNTPAMQTVQQNLPFELTAGQQAVLLDIQQDMASGKRMLRLLQGDVGSGKTVVALLAGLDVVAAGLQVAIMAPTEILSRQHHVSMGKLLVQSGVIDSESELVLLTGSLNATERQSALERIASGVAKITIGTHALFQDSVQFSNLGLVVIDEQHRFGVGQRMALANKGERPHMLLMTATPIPRSLTMVMYGDLDSSLLKEKPIGRIEIATLVMPVGRINDVVAGIARSVAKGEKVYWICPLVEEALDDDGNPTNTELSEVQAAEERYLALKAVFGDRVGLVHGKMKAEERQRVMHGFGADEYDVLVATTVIEVGVDVPSATVIVIENAERFGLSQLHQLRGRVGRGDKASSCLLLYHERCSEVARERLNIIREHTDGFLIAEEDLRLRGGGEMLGTRQSGAADFVFANLYDHRELVAVAYDDVQLIMHRDPMLETPRGKALRQLLYLFEYDQHIKLLHGG